MSDDSKLTIDDIRILAQRACAKHNLKLIDVVLLIDEDRRREHEVRVQNAEGDFFGAVRLDEEDVADRERSIYYLEQMCETTSRGAQLQGRQRRGKMKLELTKRESDRWWYRTDATSLMLVEVGYRLDGREVLAVDRVKREVALPPTMTLIPPDTTPPPPAPPTDPAPPPEDEETECLDCGSPTCFGDCTRHYDSSEECG